MDEGTTATRVCTRCGQTKGETSEFFGESRGRLRTVCRTCNRLQDAEYKRKNADKIVEQRRRTADATRLRSHRWYVNNKEKHRACVKAWHALHPGAQTEIARKWRETNREQEQQRAVRTRALSPLIGRQRTAKSKAKAKGVVVANVDYQALLLQYGSTCYLCGKTIQGYELSFDHIIPFDKGGAHIPENVRPVHALCNSKKNTKLILPSVP
ncbi:HNH endonuclease [Deinococcus sp. QL22]|uniref:HNH endonuclease n=1 Tax=Deinococcus sp. QL22 TaxID=2939437 RepID=UPI002017669A|nr:HNH endonuclease [Deinococcus sp. QL22]UQN06332.1 HNH endonuclease [Deinococcus sp. QL22]